MSDESQLLAALQHADSFFPAGGIAFSWGLETLAGEGQLPDAQALHACILGQMRWRWNTLDRPYLCAACSAVNDLERLCELDRDLDAMMLARESREGSRRAGGALLLVHERIGTAGVSAYRRRVVAGSGPGHLPVAQAVVWRGVGLSLEAVQSMSVYSLCAGLIGAALRLGIMGHLAAQQILTQLRPEIVVLLQDPPETPARAHSFTPAADIAMMRHEVLQARLFAN